MVPDSDRRRNVTQCLARAGVPKIGTKSNSEFCSLARVGQRRQLAPDPLKNVQFQNRALTVQAKGQIGTACACRFDVCCRRKMKSLGNRLPRFWFRGRPSGSTSWGNFFYFLFTFWVTFFPILGPSFENQIGTPKRGPQDNFSWGGPDFGYHFGAQNGDPKF